MAERPASPSDYLAAERTFLAWIRTGLALMGFGFVVARFGLFLQALQAGASGFQARSYGLSFWFGTGLIVVGVVVNLISARNHVHLVRQLNRGESGYTRPSSLAIAVSVILAVLGLAMAIYFISVRDPKEKSMTNSDNGIMSIPSHHSVDETVESFTRMLRANGITLFATIDHSGEARKAGFEMRPTKLLIFGNPKAGTPLMLAVSSVAIDLPLKALIWENADGKVWISYNTPSYLQARHHLPPELVQKYIGTGLDALASKAAG
jgi:uncharacterized protein (DUF302 family)/uncharacterized membrane protein YidH (DUF202 family)